MAGLFDEQYPALPLAGAGPDRSGLFAEAFADYQPPAPDYVGQVAARMRGLLGLLQPSQWQEQLGPAAWGALVPQLEQRAARAQAPGESPGYQEMMDLALNFGPGPMGLLGQIVHHGSPHKWAPEPGFPAGRPRLDKIGTGEGAQAYGHGMYFAESPEVAKSYMTAGMTFAPTDTGAMVQPVFKGKTLSEIDDPVAKSAMEAFGGAMFYGDLDPIKTAKLLEEGGFAKDAAWLRANAKDIGTEQVSRMYTLDLPDEQLPNLLDWDKPLSQQPEAVRKALETNPQIQQYIAEQEAMKKALNEMYPKRLEKLPQIATAPVDPKGSMIYEALMRRNATKMPDGAISVTDWKNAGEPASQVLKAAGIPGLRYLDAGSRGMSGTGRWKMTLPDGTTKIFDFKPNDDIVAQVGGKLEPIGTSNYVIWDQGLLDEMGRRLAKEQGLLPETIPDELPSWAPAERMAQWRTARANAALPVEQGGLGLGPANTAAERAKAGGYDYTGIHGSPEDISAFDPTWHDETALRGTALTKNPTEAAFYAAQRGEVPGGAVYPLMVRDGANPQKLYDIGIEGAKQRGITDVFGDAKELFVLDPSRIRSRFAAFDPKRRTEADLLASWLLPLVLGAGAASYGLLGQPPVD